MPLRGGKLLLLGIDDGDIGKRPRLLNCLWIWFRDDIDAEVAAGVAVVAEVGDVQPTVS